MSNHTNAQHLFWLLFASHLSNRATTTVVRRAIITPKETTEKDFVKVWKHYLILQLKTLSNKFLVIVQEPEKLKRKMLLFCMTKEMLAKCKGLLWIINYEKNGKKNVASKTDKSAANAIYLQYTSSRSESETSGEEFSPCSSKSFHASNQTVIVQLSRKILQP